MNKVKVLIYLSVILLLFNLVLIGFIMMGKPRKEGDREGPKRYIIETLHFDRNQIAAYEVLVQQHRRQIRDKEMQMMDLKQQLYSLLSVAYSAGDADSLIAAIAGVQTAIEQINFKHFQDIKNLCRPEQQAYFDKLSLEIAELFNHQGPPHER